MLKLVFSGADIILDEDNFSVNIKNSTLSNLGSREVSYTNSFSLIKDSQTLQLLQDVGLLGSTTDIYNENIECSLYDGDVPLIQNGLANILDITDFEIVLVLFSSVRALKDKLADRKLSDLDLTAHDHRLTKDVIENANADFTSPYVYSLLDY